MIGEEAHAGTAPRRARKDALSAAVAVVAALENLTRDKEDVLRFTVGRFEVHPGSPNTVPGRVHFTIDMRHPDDAVLRATGDKVASVATAAAPLCEVKVTEISYVKPTVFLPKVVDLVKKSSERLGYANLAMPSGAGHDAMHLSKICPTGMIFVPCLRGLSHNEAESATPEQLSTGARVLAGTLARLSHEPL